MASVRRHARCAVPPLCPARHFAIIAARPRRSARREFLREWRRAPPPPPPLRCAFAVFPSSTPPKEASRPPPLLSAAPQGRPELPPRRAPPGAGSFVGPAPPPARHNPD